MSPDGSDGGDGSRAAPFATIERARDAVRKERRSGNIRDFSIKLMGGSYTLSQSLEFTQEDSSEHGSRLTIEPADGDQEVRLTGGIDIPFDALTDAPDTIKNSIIDETARPHIKAVNLRAMGITDYGELSRRGHLITAGETAPMVVSVDGHDLELAAWPNEGWQTFSRKDDVTEYGTRSQQGVLQGCAFHYTDERMEQWSRPELAWLSGAIGPNYAYDFYPVESIDPETKTVTLREGAIDKDYYSKPFFRYQNILEELDRPGEYYIDRENGMLYLYPPEDASSGSMITVTMLKDHLIKLTGVKNLTIRGLTLDGGRISGISTVGESGIEGVTVKDCKIQGFGKHGVFLRNSRFTTVRDCEIYDVGENGVAISGGDYANIISGGNVVYGNDIHDFAQLERSYRAGVLVEYRSVGTKVQHNHIHDAPHTGIIFYGVDHLIENNVLENLVMEFHDMDAIYANNVEFPWERGNVIRRNYFKNIGNQTLAEPQMNVAAVRTDNSGHGLSVYQNVFYHVGKGRTNAVSGVRAQGTYNRVWENLFIDCSEAYHSNNTYQPDAAYDLTQEPYKTRARQLQGYLPVYGQRFPELYRMWDEHPQAARTNEFKHNVVVNIAFPMSTINGAQNAEGFRGAPELVEAEGNLVTRTDPGFCDYAGGDFSVQPASAAYNTVYGHTDFNIVCHGRQLQ